MSCDFCKKIWASEDEYRHQFPRPENEETAIMLDYNNKPTLYIPIWCWHYPGTYLKIDYCPYCGRKLNENDTAPSIHDTNQWLFSDLDDTIDCF